MTRAYNAAAAVVFLVVLLVIGAYYKGRVDVRTENIAEMIEMRDAFRRIVLVDSLQRVADSTGEIQRLPVPDDSFYVVGEDTAFIARLVTAITFGRPGYAQPGDTVRRQAR
jgi:hypothetical protein